MQFGNWEVCKVLESHVNRVEAVIMAHVCRGIKDDSNPRPRGAHAKVFGIIFKVSLSKEREHINDLWAISYGNKTQEEPSQVQCNHWRRVYSPLWKTHLLKWSSFGRFNVNFKQLAYGRKELTANANTGSSELHYGMFKLFSNVILYNIVFGEKLK